MSVLGRVADTALEQRQFIAGIEATRRLLSIEPWHEAGHRQLMKLLAADGQRSAALAQYETCQRLLAEELGVGPSEETTKLYEQIREGALSRDAEEQGSRGEVADLPAFLSSAPLPPSTPAPASAPPHNLPPQAIPFIGRQQEIADIIGRLQDPACRLLTLVGPGGIGKTRLALQAARLYTKPDAVSEQVGIAFPDGVYLVNFAPVETSAAGADEPDPHVANLIASTITEGLGLTFHSSVEPQEQLLNYLNDKQMLLILDNFEHLVAHAGWIVLLLHGAPQVKLLATSRERLKLREEWLMEVGGLDYPPDNWTQRVAPDEVVHLSDYSAIALFVQQAGQVQPDFSLTTHALEVARICRLVEGMPLALELAAGWLPVLPYADIATEIERNLDILTATHRNVPARHQSLRAVFEQSWHLLSGPERATFCRLSLFRGGFQREAVQKVAGTSLSVLSSLIHKSLLRLTAAGRYEVHEMLRQYAAEKFWMEYGAEAQTTWQRYSAYYLNLVKQAERRLRGSRPQQALAELRRELDNIRHAWRWAVIEGQIEDISAGLRGLSRFYDIAGLYEEGATAFALTADRLRSQFIRLDLPQPDLQLLLGRVLVEQAYLLTRQGDTEQALQLIPAVLELAETTQAIELKAMAYLQQSDTYIFQGEFVLAQAPVEQALALAQAAYLPEVEAEALRNLSSYYYVQGQYDRSITILEQALALYRQLEDHAGTAMVLMNLGNAAVGQKQYARARGWYEEALQICRDIDYQMGQAIILNNLGCTAYEEGHYMEARAYCIQALQIDRALKIPMKEVIALHTLGNVLRTLGLYTEARSIYQQCLQMARQLKVKITESYALADLGLLVHQLGDYAGACEYNHQALQIAQEIGVQSVQALALTHLGHALAARNKFAEAIEAYNQALHLYEELNLPDQALTPRAGLSQTYLAQDDLAQAQTQLEIILPRLTPDNLAGLEEPFRIYWACYQVLRAGSDARAQAVLAQAYQALQKHAAGIEDEALRHSFLENITCHRNVVQAFTTLLSQSHKPHSPQPR